MTDRSSSLSFLIGWATVVLLYYLVFCPHRRNIHDCIVHGRALCVQQ